MVIDRDAVPRGNIARLQEETKKILNRLDKLYDDKAGFIEPDFF